MKDEENLRQKVIKRVKLSAVGVEIVGIVAIILAFSLLSRHHIIELPPMFSCQIPVLEMPSAVDSDYFWGEYIEGVCNAGVIIKLAAIVSLPYLFLCILLISSPLKASPVMYFFKAYLLNEEGGRPKFHEAMKLILLSRTAIPFYYAYFYCAYYGFTLGLHPLINLSFSLAGFSSLLMVFAVFDKSDLVWEERISGLRIHVREKKLAKDIKFRSHWFGGIHDKVGGDKIAATFALLFWGILTINVLRDGFPPADYDEVLYKRPAPVWEDNAYFALAGLDAPEGVKDFYTYGCEEVIYYSRAFTRYKEQLGIPYTHDVPEISYSLYRPNKEEKTFHLKEYDVDDWRCLYSLASKANSSACPDKADVLALIHDNPELWRRFHDLPSYASFSIPDLFLDGYYSGKDLISLARLNAVYILDLQEQGHSDEAIEEWQRYWDLYLNMVHAHTNMVNKAVFLVLVGIQFDVLETLLYNEPELALQYGEQITNAVDIRDVGFFYVRDMLSDDWRMLEPFTLVPMGSMPYQKRLMRQCIGQWNEIGDLSAKEYMALKDYEFCSDIYPLDPNEWLFASFTSPGNPVTNIIQYLLIGGVLKGGEMIANMHKNISDHVKVHVAVQLIKNKVASENVQAYLNAMPEAYWDPVTEAPFLWDEEKQVLYTPSIDNPNMDRGREFYVNLMFGVEE